MPRDRRGRPHPTLLAVYALITGPRTTRALKLALDTGASYTLLPPDLLVDIGHHPATARRHLELTTASGTILVPIVRVRSVQCLGMEVKGLEVAAHHLPPEGPVEGLLGLNFLRHFPPYQQFVHHIAPFRH